MTKIHKLTLVVHPFNEIKPTERDSLEIIKGVGYKSLSQDPFLTCDDPEGQLTKSGWSPETANFCRKNFSAYCRGLELAADGTVLVLRAPRFDAFVGFEQNLFSAAKEIIPPEQLYFFPGFDDKCIEQSELERLGKTGIVKLLLEIAGGEKDAFKQTELVSFGEYLHLCVLDETATLHSELDIKRKARIQANLCSSLNVMEADFQIEDGKTVTSCQPKSIHEARQLLSKSEGFDKNKITIDWVE